MSARTLFFLFCAISGWATVSHLAAEPYIAARMGMKCAQCHVNRTGGGKRTAYGALFSQTKLPMKVMGGESGTSIFDGNLNESISAGTDFRVNDVTLLEYTGSTGERAGSNNELGLVEANVYLQIDLVKDFLLFYIDESLSPTSFSRELFGMVSGQTLGAYFKVGRMLLPYGLRLLDNDAFIRNRTGYTFNRHDLGVEFGMTPGPYLVVSNLTNTQLTLLGSMTFRRFRVGGSYGRSTVEGDHFVVGSFGGATFDRLTLLGEIDLIREGEFDRLALLLEADYLVRNGLNAKFTYEFFDRNRDVDVDRDGQERFTLGIEPFLTQFMQVGLFYRINRFIPQNVSQNQDRLTLQTHFFF